MISVDNVRFGYGRGAPVLVDVAFDVAEGEILAIAGPNGSGKSTLIGLLDGFHKPAAGRVLLDGKPIASMPRRDVAQLVGYVAQGAEFHFPLTVLEYVLQGRFAHGHLLGFESEEDFEAARWAMRITETSVFLERRLDELSGGERQRVMLARALAQKPRVLLLDEFTANLDISHQVRMLALVRDLAHGCRMAAVVVTHDLNLAAEFADRILLLGDGKVRGLGQPRDVLTPERLESLFHIPVLIDTNPSSGAPRVTVVSTAESRAH